MSTKQSDSIAPVSEWIRGVKLGDGDAAHNLWAHCFAKLIAMSRKRLKGLNTPIVDEEIIANHAYESFCLRAARFPKLEDRSDLWRIMATIVSRKVYKASRKKQPANGTDIEQTEESGPSATDEVIADDEVQRLLELLGSDRLRTVAILKLEGHNHNEIAKGIGRAASSVERYVRRIRETWEPEIGAEA
ncbi:MAG: hypothetical protein KDB27_21880 [Planctomycetales bacterium]|nr:hypothetical protein [Planctomycetales bacterium]